MKIIISYNLLKIKKQLKDVESNLPFLYDITSNENFQFALTWFILYVAFIILNLMVNKIFNSKFILPNSLLVFINSSWGAFLVISFILSLIFKYFYNTNIYLKDKVLVNNTNVLFLKSTFLMTTFLCETPILHSRKDFSFFINNFKPLSIELRLKNQLVYVNLYGKEINSFERKKTECFNLLSAMFSKVTLLSNSDLEAYFCSGYKLYLKSKVFKEIFEIDKIKKKIGDMAKVDITQINTFSNNFNSNSINTDLPLNIMNFDTLLLMAFGEKDRVNNYTQHSFRGIRLGSINSTALGSLSFNTKLQIKQFKNIILSCIRIPEKNSSGSSIENFNKVYFFIIHKFFNYYFTNEEKNLENEIDLNLPVRDDNIEKNTNQFKNMTTSIYNNEIKSSYELPLESTLVTNSVPINNLKNIIFQYTYFCQFFCPIMIKEFKRINREHKKSLKIPDTCYEHLLLSNKNLTLFSKSKGIKKGTNTIYNNSRIRDEFLSFINELELPLIDKICHFSSTLILSPERYSINDELIIKFIKDLDENYFLK